MRLTRNLLPVVLLAALAVPALANAGDVTWSASLQPADVRAGEGAQVVLTARIEGDYHIYSLTKRASGPNVTTITLDNDAALEQAGAAVQPRPRAEIDRGFGIEVESYTGGVAFGLPVTVRATAAGAQKAFISVRYQVCRMGTCLLPKTISVPLTFTAAAGAARPDRLAGVTSIPAQPSFATTVPSSAAPAVPPKGPAGGGDAYRRQLQEAREGGLLGFVLFAVAAGFTALLTPCVFPMIPITVSFFTKRKDQDSKRAVRDAVAYCLGIVGTFTVLGILMTLIFGAAGISNLAASPFVNLGLAILFIALAANLLGAFEITAMTVLANKTQTGTTRDGVLGPVLMGLTFTLTSFTCTVAFVGTLLASAARGGLFYPVIGMLAFGAAFASPFFLLALFPQFLTKLPRSGSWMITVKAYLGLIELAAALKFLSNADLVWHLGLLTRPIFLALWSMIGVVAGLYMIGWLRLKVDEGTRVGWGRRIVGIVTVAVGVYCLAAIEGAPLGKVDAYIPASPYPGRHVASDRVRAPGIVWTHDYAAAMVRSKAEHRPIFINFTGYTCTNCRLMEQEVFPRQDVQRVLAAYIPVELYTDDNAVGPADQKIEQELAHVLTLPVYVIVPTDGSAPIVQQGAVFDGRLFAEFVRSGLPAVASASQ